MNDIVSSLESAARDMNNKNVEVTRKKCKLIRPSTNSCHALKVKISIKHDNDLLRSYSEFESTTSKELWDKMKVNIKHCISEKYQRDAIVTLEG